MFSTRFGIFRWNHQCNKATQGRRFEPGDTLILRFGGNDIKVEGRNLPALRDFTSEHKDAAVTELCKRGEGRTGDRIMNPGNPRGSREAENQEGGKLPRRIAEPPRLSIMGIS